MRITTNGRITYISDVETREYNGKEFTKQYVLIHVKEGEYEHTLECELGRYIKAGELRPGIEYDCSIAIQGRQYESKKQEGVLKAFNKLVLTSATPIQTAEILSVVPEQPPVGFDDLPF